VVAIVVDSLPDSLEDGMEIIRTPEACFEGLEDYPFAPHYAEIPDLEGGTLRMHYVDEGPKDAPPVVFIHGNPTWSYEWRKMIPAVVASGHRAIAVDLVGMGRSDKPTRMEDFSVARHVEWTRAALIDVLGLEDITLVLHDWGGIVGLRILHHHMDRIARVCLTNSGLFLRDPSEPMPEKIEAGGPFAAFQKMVLETEDWPHWEMLSAMCQSELSQKVVDAYHAPYPEPRFLCGNRQFTQMLATRPDNPQLPDNWEAWLSVKRFERPMLTIFSDGDQIARGSERRFIEEVPGCKGQPHVILEGGSHFLQEDIPEAFNAALVAWLESTPARVGEGRR
jgi:haloalkane dehalogenase